MATLPDPTYYYRAVGAADDAWTEDTDGTITPPLGTPMEYKAVYPSASTFRTMTINDLLPKVWLDASVSSSLPSSGAVDQWDDLSGNGFHFVQATGADQPEVSSLAGKSSVYFDGSTFLDHAGNVFYPTDELTIFAVMARTERPTAAYPLHCGLKNNTYSAALRFSSTTTNAIRTLGRMIDGDSAVSAVGTKDPALSAPFYVASTFLRNGSVTQYQQGVSSVATAGLTDNAMTSNGNAGITIGCNWRDDATARSDFFTGHLHEIAIFDRVLSAGELAQLDAYAQAKWSTV